MMSIAGVHVSALYMRGLAAQYVRVRTRVQVTHRSFFARSVTIHSTLASRAPMLCPAVCDDL
jgi:hypothetical protein